VLCSIGVFLLVDYFRFRFLHYATILPFWTEVKLRVCSGIQTSHAIIELLFILVYTMIEGRRVYHFPFTKNHLGYTS